MKDAAKALAAWCAQRRLSPARLARLVGCSPTTARRWLLGEQEPAPEYRVKLYELTRLPEIEPSPADQLKASAPADMERFAREAEEVGKALLFLERALRPFVEGSPAAREFLRRSELRDRLARVTGVAQLLLDEEAFADWRLLDGVLGGGDDSR
ncbi:MAG: hypothetical protein K6U08_05570 [Firmicutes bacterium]|nr:hypothetical protein [Bacillota bacterium]